MFNIFQNVNNMFKGNTNKSTSHAVSELLSEFGNSRENEFNHYISRFKEFVKNKDSAGDFVYDLFVFIDNVSNKPQIVYKSLKVILFFLHTLPKYFSEIISAFSPEIITITLLHFNEMNYAGREKIHRLAFEIYKSVIKNEPLPSLEKYKIKVSGSKTQNSQPQQPKKLTEQERRRMMMQNQAIMGGGDFEDDGGFGFTSFDDGDDNIKYDDNMGDMISFNQLDGNAKPSTQQGPTEDIMNRLPQKDRPHLPAAFARMGRNGEDTEQGMNMGYNANDEERQGLFTKYEENLLDSGADDNDELEFDPMATMGNSQGTSFSFDIFGKPSSGSTTFQQFQPFDPSGGFDPFGTNQKSDKIESDSRNQFSNSNDILNDFESNDQGKKDQQAPNDIFDMIDDYQIINTSEQGNAAKGNGIFDPFGNPNSQQQKKSDGFGIFGSLNGSSAPQQKVSNSIEPFNPFGDSSAQQQKKSVTVNEFNIPGDSDATQQKRSESTSIFDSLDSSNALQQKKSDNSNVFNPFGNSDVPQTKKPDVIGAFNPFSDPNSQQQKKSDGFGIFDSLNSSSAPQQKASSGIESFNPFSASNTQQQKKPDDVNAFNTLGDSKTLQRKKSDIIGVFDPFSNSGTAQQKKFDSSGVFDPFNNSHVPQLNKADDSESVDFQQSAPTHETTQQDSGTFDPFAPTQSALPKDKGSFDPFATTQDGAQKQQPSQNPRPKNVFDFL